MTGISDSSIQPWLDFQGDNLPANIPSCQTRQTDGRVILDGCLTVCNQSVELLNSDKPNNLPTCGLYATLTMLDAYTLARNPIGSYDDSHDQYVALLGRFSNLGLKANDVAYALAARNAVSATMTVLQKITNIQTFRGDSLLEGACSEQALFPSATFGFNTDLPQHLRDCVNAICAPRSLNPDLGGIGVRISRYGISHQTLKFCLGFHIAIVADLYRCSNMYWALVLHLLAKV